MEGGPPLTSDSHIVTAMDLHRRIGEGPAVVDALDGVTLAFEHGRFRRDHGAERLGKSTLMHILAGLDTPTGGSVTLDGLALEELDTAS